MVPSWYYRPGYVRVMAKLILEQLLEFSVEEMKEGRSFCQCVYCINVLYVFIYLCVASLLLTLLSRRYM